MISNADALRILEQLAADMPGLDPLVLRRWLCLAAYRIDYYQTGDEVSFLRRMRRVLPMTVEFERALVVVQDLDLKLAPVRAHIDLMKLLEAILSAPTDETFAKWSEVAPDQP
jgi:hypothetical protein